MGREDEALRAGRPGRRLDHGRSRYGLGASRRAARRRGGGAAGHRAGQPAGVRFHLPGVEVVARLLLPLPRRRRDAPHPSERARFTLGRELHRRELPARQLLQHRMERPAHQGHACVERAARFRGDPRGLRVREGTERRLAQAGTTAPALRPAAEDQKPVMGRAGRLSGVVLAVFTATVTPDAGPAQQRLTREQVLEALDRASPAHPADFTGKDLSGLDLSGVDFKRANLSRCQLVKTSLVKAQLFSVTLSDAIATDADFTGAKLDASVMYRVDMRRAVLRDASLFAVIASDANFSDADLAHARIIAPMSNAKFARAKLANADLGADPGNQSMGIMRTDASGVDFTGADFSGANLRKVLLVRADLTGADLTDADVTGADLSGAILRSIRGRDRIRGLDKAIHADQAIFND